MTALAESEPKPTPLAIRKCAEWLQFCLSIGWKHADLDSLEADWWKYHDRNGRLIRAVNAAGKGKRP